MSEDQYLLIASAAYVILEYWLGKTDMVKPGSALEAVLLLAKKLLKRPEA